MRNVLMASILAFIVFPCFAGPIATYSPDKSTGLDIVTVPDGQWQYKVFDGKKAASLRANAAPNNLYLYFKFDPDTRKKLGSEAYLVVDFYDSGIGTVGLQINGQKNPYEGAPGLLLLDSRKWQRSMIHITGASFTGAQNEGADFRFVRGGGISISRIEVYASKPKLDIPTDKERANKAAPMDRRPSDMFYTFGNDADESSAPLFKSLGVTSIESYVTWESCERDGEGKWDWSDWDKRVQIFKDNDLKWVPFLILGPAYSTPNWFRASKDHIPCCCLEHGTDSKIESLWNPNLPKWIDRFIGEFAKRYEKTGVIESVLLGIQGDYGEAIYSVSGGGWTFNVPGEYHNHQGYWCSDPYALASFRKYVEKKYGSTDTVNKAWGTSLANFDKVNFPGRADELKLFQDRVKSGDAQARRQWLDFIDWYRESMTNWADYWIATTRKYFPKTPIYLCTGGDAIPPHGSNFAEQCRIAAKYGAGVRITNEASNYVSNFIITRWVASAGKHYGSYFGFEPAGAENEVGIVARIYNATASGANQLHDYSNNVTDSSTRIDSQRKHIKYLFHVPKPIVPVALWYPNVSMSLQWGGYFEKAGMLRDLVDYDYIDESMLHTGALDEHKMLIILHGNVMEIQDADRIADWVKKGGRLIVMGVPKFESVEGTPDPEVALFGDTPQGRTLDKGEVVRVTDQDDLSKRLASDLGALGLPVYDLNKDGVFGTQIAEDKLLFLNTGAATVPLRIDYKGKITTAHINGATITEVELK